MQIRVMPLQDNNALSHRANALQNNGSQQRMSSGRHRRHVETPAVFTGNAPERKTRKRRSADKVGASLVSSVCFHCLYQCITEDKKLVFFIVLVFVSYISYVLLNFL